jgi:divalent metal cation (Fe/Co/Zn/Cd) transporter
MTILESHSLASVVEKSVKEKFKIVLTIHVEPKNTESCPKA